MGLTTLSQTNKLLYYFDNSLNSTTKAKSVFIGIGSPDSGLVKLNCFVNASGQLMISAYFTDSTLKINHGLFQSYYSNGYKEFEGNYVYNNKMGIWKKWDSLGYITDSSVFENGLKIFSDSFTYYDNGFVKSDKMEDKKTGKLKNVQYDDKGNIQQEAIFTGKSGILKYKADGVIKIDSVFGREEMEASFPGGEGAWNKFIKHAIETHIDEFTNANKSGTCRIKFIVDTDGSLSDVEALTMKGTLFAKLIVEEFKKGPKWIPATQYGRYVRAYREQPVTFTIAR
jgi:protein TonB